MDYPEINLPKVGFFVVYSILLTCLSIFAGAPLALCRQAGLLF